MKTLFTIIAIFLTVTLSAQDTCHLKAKIKITKPGDCEPCSGLWASANKRVSLTYSWNTGSSNDSIRVCDTTIQTYSVTITDTAGCVSTDTIQTANSKKCTDICHRRGHGRKTVWNNQCVPSNAVKAHQLHGDSTGCCGSNQPTHVLHVNNGNGHGHGRNKLSIEFYSYDVERIVITLTNLDGKQYHVYEGVTDEGNVKVDVDTGIYLLTMQTATGIVTRKVFVP